MLRIIEQLEKDTGALASIGKGTCRQMAVATMAAWKEAGCSIVHDTLPHEREVDFKGVEIIALWKWKSSVYRAFFQEINPKNEKLPHVGFKV